MSTPPPFPAFSTQGITRRYRLGETLVEALRGVDLAIARGELVTVAGPSGSGKSTLLHLLGGLDEPDEGRVLVDGVDLAALRDRERTLLRRRQLGFVFQTFNLVPVLTALENVEYPLLLDGRPAAERRRRAADALAAVGLSERLGHRPDQLSGGERQRVAIARAIVHEPLALLADEPTGNLDSATAAEILDLLVGLCRERGTTVVVATHDPALVARAPRRIALHDGRVERDERGSEA
ncbi:MAG TPA: ABC transporter ATP-binding protein [Thermoanaerobaculia bacterium]|nr:ABC transporter ATP-binding protein [Thermoanaerobaculia bacterium]